MSCKQCRFTKSKKEKNISRGRVERPISRFRGNKLQSCALDQLGYREWLLMEESISSLILDSPLLCLSQSRQDQWIRVLVLAWQLPAQFVFTPWDSRVSTSNHSASERTPRSLSMRSSCSPSEVLNNSQLLFLTLKIARWLSGFHSIPILALQLPLISTTLWILTYWSCSLCHLLTPYIIVIDGR